MQDTQISTSFVTTKQCRSNNHQEITANTDECFLSFLNIVNSKSYIPVIGCIFEHILTDAKLSNSEKLYYFLADSLALINNNLGKKRAATLPSEKWAAKLNCSRAKIFALQKSLEEKGYFQIIKEKNSSGQNKRNMIIPTLPKDVFDSVSKLPNRSGEHLAYNCFTESKRDYLDRTKLFIKLNYKLLFMITSNHQLNNLQKVIWLDFYGLCYKNINQLIKKASKKLSFSFTSSYKDLASRYSCSEKHLSRAIKALQKCGFVGTKHFYIKKKLTDQDRQDRSLWKLNLTLPNDCASQLMQTANRSSFKPCVVHQKYVGTISDPHITKSIPLLNKDLQSENKKYRSTESTFCQNSVNLEQKQICYHRSISSKEIKIWKLQDFYPLTQEDCNILQSSSGRQFSLNSMNEILLDMSKRLTDRHFNGKRAFLNYMGMVLFYEIRDAVKISNINFRIRNNISKAEEKFRVVEKYLTKVENSSCTSPSSRLKKRFASVLNPFKSYDLLKAYNQVIRSGETAYLCLDRYIQLTELEKRVILEQIKEIYENIDLESKLMEPIKILKITISNISSSKKRTEQISESLTSIGIWSNIRCKLKDIYGAGIDQNWFSKLEIIEDREKSEINIKPISLFVKDWVMQNYLDTIEKLAEKEQYKISLH